MRKRIDTFIGHLMAVLVVIRAGKVDEFVDGRVTVERIRRKGHKTIYRIVERSKA